MSFAISLENEIKQQRIIPLLLLSKASLSQWLEKQSDFIRTWVMSGRCKNEGDMCIVPDEQGKIHSAVLVVNSENNFWAIANAAKALPKGNYQIQAEMTQEQLHRYALAWGLQAYRFQRYKKYETQDAQLVLPKDLNLNAVMAELEAICLVRDLVNTPTEDMGPDQLSHQAQQLATEHQASCKVIVGEELLKQNFPAIHTVGRASHVAPRLIDLTWGDESHPKVTLVGKGVCFDTGGLDLKPASAMLLMKKDMGGAAHVLGLAHWIMSVKLPVRLRVLIPAVENAVSSNAYRPGDIIATRKGLSVEIGNTDAEGRLVLADALAEASSEQPEKIIDFATLTGAARIATGSELPAFFCNEETMAANLITASDQSLDPIWRLPLFKPYREWLDTPFADINNTSSQPTGGAITAALFLQEFVDDTIPWAHFDVMAWNVMDKPGKPRGGEAQGLRTMMAYLINEYR